MPAPPLADAPTATWRIDLAWDGRGFVGWQRQPDGPSLQGAVEGALERLLGEAVAARAAGRTDAGVHALQQVVAFDTHARRTAERLVAGLNHLLPPSIACLGARPERPGFDPRRACTSKLYRYRILLRRARCPFRAGLTWHLGQELDLAAMDRAAQALVGRHDFSAFRARGCGAAHPVRWLQSARVTGHEDEAWLHFEGHGFLRHQVRIMTGALVEVGRGRRPEAWLGELLRGRDRQAAAETAPAEGLWLAEVRLGARGVAPDGVVGEEDGGED